MMRGTSRWAQRALAICAATVLFGCDDYGEKKSLDVQSQAAAMRQAGEGGSDESVKLLQSVATGSGNSPVLIQAQQSLGQVQLAKADAGASELASLTSDANATLFRIGELARQARTSVVLANNYRQLDPKVSVEQIGDTTAKARGDGNAEAYPIDAAKIPTLAIAQQNKSKLDGEIAQTQQAIAAATQERDAALADAGKASASAESEAGDARAATVKQIADLHTKAAAAARKLGDLNATLAHRQADETEQAGLVLQLQAAVDSMTAQGTSLSQSWTALSAKASDQTALAKKILEGDGESVKALTTKLNTQLKEIDAKREETEQLYKDAITSLGQAADKSGQRTTELEKAKSDSKGGAYEVGAWDHEKSLIAVDRINIDKSAAEKGLADLYGAKAQWLVAEIATSADVEEVSGQLNVAAAEPFNADKLKTELTKTVNDSNDAYETVKATLDGIRLDTEDLAPLKITKAMRKIVTLSDQASLAALAAAAKVAPEVAKKADDFKKDMTAAAAEAKETNTPLPALPVSLGGVMATTAPAAETSAAATTDDATTTALRDAMTKALALFEAGKIDELKSSAIVEEGGEVELAQFADMVKKMQHFKTAAGPKFSDNPAYQALDAQSISSTNTPKSVKFKIADDKAYVEPVKEGEGEDFCLVDGTWKPVFGTTKTDAVKAEKAKMLAIVGVLDQAATEIEAGTLTDFAEVLKRVEAVAGGATTAPAAATEAAPAAAPATPVAP